MSTSIPTTLIAPPPTSRRGRSVVAVGAALLANAAAAFVVDEVLHLLAVYPPWGERMDDPALYALALAYRLPLGVGAGYLVARLAPTAPVRHANALAIVGTLLGAAGVAAAVSHPELGPLWYPVALVLLGYPTVRLGAAWYVRRTGRR